MNYAAAHCRRDTGCFTPRLRGLLEDAIRHARLYVTAPMIDDIPAIDVLLHFDRFLIRAMPPIIFWASRRRCARQISRNADVAGAVGMLSRIIRPRCKCRLTTGMVRSFTHATAACREFICCRALEIASAALSFDVILPLKN